MSGGGEPVGAGADDQQRDVGQPLHRAHYPRAQAMQPIETVADPRTTPVLAGGARTPVGRFRGALSEVPAVELGAHAVRAALDRCPGLQPDYVAMGNVLQAANGQNPGRRAAILGGVARDAGITLNDVCLASMSSVAVAAGMIRAGEASCVLVGGFDSMTGAPHAVHVRNGAAAGDRNMIDVMQHDGLWCGIAGSGMGELSDRENERLGIDRASQDAFALASHLRRLPPPRAGAWPRRSPRCGPWAASLTATRASGPTPRPSASRHCRRPSPRRARSRPATRHSFRRGRRGPRHRPADGPRDGHRAAGRDRRRAVVAGPDSTLHLRPAEASEKLLAAQQLTAADIDLWEINEAFAGVALASIDALGIDAERVNVNGGAIAVGHPLAASGFRLVLTLAMELQRHGATHGIATLCGRRTGRGGPPTQALMQPSGEWTPLLRGIGARTRRKDSPCRR